MILNANICYFDKTATKDIQKFSLMEQQNLKAVFGGVT